MTENNDTFGFDDLDLDSAPKSTSNAKAVTAQGEQGGSTGTSGMMTAPSSNENPEELLGDIKSSITQMQEQMQDTYQKLTNTRLTGQSNDGHVKLTMTATYSFEDIEMSDNALDGGTSELKWRIREAFRDLLKKIQDRTQEQTMNLLQGMDIPDEIRQLSSEEG